MELDATDRKLLTLLSEDARQPYAELGKKLHLSAPAVHARVKKLEALGVLQRYTVRLDADAIGKPVCAFIRISAPCSPCEETARALAKLPEIEEAHSVAGEDCVLVKVRTATPAALQELLQRMRTIPGFERTVTTMVLRTHFERGTTPSAL